MMVGALNKVTRNNVKMDSYFRWMITIWEGSKKKVLKL